MSQILAENASTDEADTGADADADADGGQHRSLAASTALEAVDEQLRAMRRESPEARAEEDRSGAVNRSMDYLSD